MNLRATQHGTQRTYVPLPTQKWCRRCRESGFQDSSCSTPAGNSRGESCALSLGETQGVSEGSDGVGVGVSPPAPLQVAYGVGGEPGASGQFFLGQPGNLPQLPQTCPER